MTVLPETEALVRTLPFCSMSMMVAPAGVTVPEPGQLGQYSNFTFFYIYILVKAFGFSRVQSGKREEGGVKVGLAKMSRRLGALTSGGRSARECNGTKVREGDEGAARRKVLDDPLSIELLQGVALRGEGMCDGGSLEKGRQVSVMMSISRKL